MTKNEPLPITENVLLSEETHTSTKRNYVTKKQILDLAESKGSDGLTLYDIKVDLRLSKRAGQRKLKYFHAKKVLFTAQDLIEQGLELPPTFKNRRPQRYYATSIKAGILEKIRKDHKNVLLHTTEITSFNPPLFQALEDQKANSFFEVLQLLSFSPTYIHKINLLLSIGKNNYKETSELLERPLQGIDENIGKNRVKYIYHPNGSVQIFIACSKHPHKLETDNDVNMFFSLIGQVKDRMTVHLQDPWELIIPSVDTWVLKQCDINNDIPITDKAQTYLPDIQLKTAGKVFRMYVKSLGDKAVCRCEDSNETNIPLSSFNVLFRPNLNLEKKIENLAEKIENFSLGLNWMKYYPIIPFTSYTFSIF